MNKKTVRTAYCRGSPNSLSTNNYYPIICLCKIHLWHNNFFENLKNQ
ncbi:hypothetical protein HMPREF6123_1428 [Oribacterium sinus F0268]|uniref:Uncharacterized protein n=1 Tax=Oribacterium sinus F0268 TaxID=585501 RepID=C2KY59_9FIRM|nr:hypothetical protein HMPREF6123_1428 [Oribacterium sinus F0268]